MTEPTNQIYGHLFARKDIDGDYCILHNETGEPVDRLDEPTIYPVGSDVSCCYEHAEGIVLTFAQVEMLGLEVE